MTLGTDRLSNDWYNVFRSITKFGYYKKTFITEQLKKEGKFHNQFCEINKKGYFKSVLKFREFQRSCPCEKNEKFCGIPQGSAISAVFANVYATDFDIKMKTISERYNGTYKRYSDDFILIIPKNYDSNEISFEEVKDIEMTVRNVAKNNRIEIQEEKTELLEYRQEKILNLRNLEKNQLDYLGFIFDGNTVKMRGKSPYKFYRQAYKLTDRAVKVKNKKQLSKIPYRKQLYGLYTDLGIERGAYGNFITYVKRAQQNFDFLSPNTKNIMLKQIKNRKKNIERKLGMKIHTPAP